MRWMFSCLLVVLLTACGRPQADLVIASNSWLGATPVHTYAALQPEGMPPHLKPIMLVSDISVLRMLGNEAAVGAVVTLGNALGANTLTHGDYCIAMVVDRSFGGDAIVARPGWHYQPGQQVRVGLEDSTAARAMLAQWMAHQNIALTQVTTRAVLPTEHAVAFAEQEVDVIVTYEPFVQQLLRQQARVLFDSTETPIPVVDVLIVANTAWPQVAPVVQALLQGAWPQSLRALAQREPTFWQGLQRLTQLNEAELSRAVAGVSFYPADEQHMAMDDVLTKDMPKVAELLVRAGIFQQVVPLQRCETQQ
ncbi:hypothetical protein [Pseudidiomarina sediminum]|nr:hypothetical protein [Pseudidiomarina sediminum]MBY6063956.1 hypothetical protein [Pseudidiomarina sediminum]